MFIPFQNDWYEIDHHISQESFFTLSFTLYLSSVDTKLSGGWPWWQISYPKHIRDNLNRCHNMLPWTKINQHRWAELHWKRQRGRYSGLAIWSCVTIPAGMIHLWNAGVLHLFTYLILAHPVWLLLLNNSGNNCEGVGENVNKSEVQLSLDTNPVVHL